LVSQVSTPHAQTAQWRFPQWRLPGKYVYKNEEMVVEAKQSWPPKACFLFLIVWECTKKYAAGQRPLKRHFAGFCGQRPQGPRDHGEPQEPLGCSVFGPSEPLSTQPVFGSSPRLHGPCLGPVELTQHLQNLPNTFRNYPTPSGFTHPFRIYPPPSEFTHHFQNLPTLLFLFTEKSVLGPLDLCIPF